MKQSFKYGLLLLLLLLLHSWVMNGDGEATASFSISHPNCCISQDRPLHRAINRLYHFYSTLQFCDLSHADLSSNGPTEKGFLTAGGYPGEYKHNYIPGEISFPLPRYHNPHPITYYIYGLRKIVI